MRILLALTLSAPLIACASSPARELPVVLSRVGDDALSVRAAREIERALQYSDEFKLVAADQPGMRLTAPAENVTTRDGIAFVSGRIGYSDDESVALAAECRETQLDDCAYQLLYQMSPRLQFFGLEQ